MLNANRDQLRHSAQTKQIAASALMSEVGTHPVPAVYLAHVALECALKRRILIKNKVKHIDELKRHLPSNTYEGLFSGSTGHDLHHLQDTAGLRRYLAANKQEQLLERNEWHSMGGQRPYSLRYGIEAVTLKNAKSQVQFTMRLIDLILKEAL